MEKGQKVLLSYYLSLLLPVGGGILLLLFVLGSVWFNLNQGQSIEQLKKQTSNLTQENAMLKNQIALITEEQKILQEKNADLSDEKAEQDGNISALSLKLARIDSKIQVYLDSKGKTCYGESDSCLDVLVSALTVVVKPECSPTQDDICPANCTASTDYDCCQIKGLRWVTGKGCYWN